MPRSDKALIAKNTNKTGTPDNFRTTLHHFGAIAKNVRKRGADKIGKLSGRTSR